jgi:hypothetical protein
MATNIILVYVYISIYYTGMGLVTYSQDPTAYELICISYSVKAGLEIQWHSDGMSMVL